MDIFAKILATLGLVALNGYFVACEFAAVSARQTRLELEAQHSILGRMALSIKKRLDLYLDSTQLGITLASLGLGAVTEPAVVKILHPVLSWFKFSPSTEHTIAFSVAFATTTSLHIIIGEQVPKNWAIRYGERTLIYLAPSLIIFTYLFYPFIIALNWMTRGVLKMTGMDLSGNAHGPLPHSAEELRTLLVEGAAHGSLDKSNVALVESAFDFGDLKVRQIMTPRPQVAYLMMDQPINEILRTVQKSAFTRFPLCAPDLDNVVGLVHMKDLFNHLKLIPGRLRFTDDKSSTGETIAIADGLPGSQVHVIGSGDIDLKAIKHDILFVMDQLPVPKLLQQFQLSRAHMAIVVDEYGTTQGIVTMEDVLEEIVGEIEDEFDANAPLTFQAEGENYRVSGLYPLHDLLGQLPMLKIDGEDVDTVGGYVVRELGRLPRPGDTVEMNPYVARVISVNQKRVGQILISPQTQEAMRADGPGPV